jgi:hypothetical protein
MLREIIDTAQPMGIPDGDAQQVQEIPQMTVQVAEAPGHIPKPVSAFIENERDVSLPYQHTDCIKKKKKVKSQLRS